MLSSLTDDVLHRIASLLLAHIVKHCNGISTFGLDHVHVPNLLTAEFTDLSLRIRSAADEGGGVKGSIGVNGGEEKAKAAPETTAREGRRR